MLGSEGLVGAGPREELRCGAATLPPQLPQGVPVWLFVCRHVLGRQGQAKTVGDRGQNGAKNRKSVKEQHRLRRRPGWLLLSLCVLTTGSV